jgi:hypothetical protein
MKGESEKSAAVLTCEHPRETPSYRLLKINAPATWQ